MRRRSSGSSRSTRCTEVAKPPGVHLALLRGLNVGVKNRLRMSDLSTAFVDAGCCDIHTYIQSGNVVFRATPAVAQGAPRLIGETIADRFGCQTPIVTRSAEELRRVARHNPFLVDGADTGMLHVAFLSGRPTVAASRSLDTHRSAPDEFRVCGCEIYLRCPHGLARTKLTNQYFESRLGSISTIRSWRTVVKLQELIGAVEADGVP